MFELIYSHLCQGMAVRPFPLVGLFFVPDIASRQQRPARTRADSGKVNTETKLSSTDQQKLR